MRLAVIGHRVLVAHDGHYHAGQGVDGQRARHIGHSVVALHRIAHRCDGILARILAGLAAEGVANQALRLAVYQSGNSGGQLGIGLAVGLGLVIRGDGDLRRGDGEVAGLIGDLVVALHLIAAGSDGVLAHVIAFSTGQGHGQLRLVDVIALIILRDEGQGRVCLAVNLGQAVRGHGDVGQPLGRQGGVLFNYGTEVERLSRILGKPALEGVAFPGRVFGLGGRLLDRHDLVCRRFARAFTGHELHRVDLRQHVVDPLVACRRVLVQERIRPPHDHLFRIAEICGRRSTVYHDVTGHAAAVQCQAHAVLRSTAGGRQLDITVDHAVAGHGDTHGRIARIAAHVEGKAARRIRLDRGILDGRIAIIVGQGVGAGIAGIVHRQRHIVQRQVAVILYQHLRLLGGDGAVLEGDVVVLEQLERLGLSARAAHHGPIHCVGMAAEIDRQAFGELALRHLDAVAAGVLQQLHLVAVDRRVHGLLEGLVDGIADLRHRLAKPGGQGDVTVDGHGEVERGFRVVDEPAREEHAVLLRRRIGLGGLVAGEHGLRTVGRFVDHEGHGELPRQGAGVVAVVLPTVAFRGLMVEGVLLGDRRIGISVGVAVVDGLRAVGGQLDLTVQRAALQQQVHTVLRVSVAGIDLDIAVDHAVAGHRHAHGRIARIAAHVEGKAVDVGCLQVGPAVIRRVDGGIFNDDFSVVVAQGVLVVVLALEAQVHVFERQVRVVLNEEYQATGFPGAAGDCAVLERNLVVLQQLEALGLRSGAADGGSIHGVSVSTEVHRQAGLKLALRHLDAIAAGVLQQLHLVAVDRRVHGSLERGIVVFADPRHRIGNCEVLRTDATVIILGFGDRRPHGIVARLGRHGGAIGAVISILQLVFVGHRAVTGVAFRRHAGFVRRLAISPARYTHNRRYVGLANGKAYDRSRRAFVIGRLRHCGVDFKGAGIGRH